jgi:hypothetical protein
VVWDATSFAKRANLSVIVDPTTNKILVDSVSSGGTYNLNNGDQFTFTIRGILPNQQTSDFTFTLTIGAVVAVCTVTAPTVLNQAYQINDA